MGNIYTICFLHDEDENNSNQIITPAFIINYNSLTKNIDTSIPRIIENYYGDDNNL